MNTVLKEGEIHPLNTVMGPHLCTVGVDLPQANYVFPGQVR